MATADSLPVLANDALRVLRLGLDRWNADDFEGIYELWNPDVVVKPDPYFPDSEVLHGVAAARRFWQGQREAMGLGELEILEEHELGDDRCLARIRQHVRAPASGVESSYDWSVIMSVRAGKAISYEFFIDRDHGLAAAGLR